MFQQQNDSVPVELDSNEVIEGLHDNVEFIVQFFLSTEEIMPTPDFHKKIWKMLTDLNMTYLVFAVPRGHAKTTLAKLSVVWYFLFTKFDFCTYLSNTYPMAVNAAKDIIAMLECDNFVSVFGPLHFDKRSEGDGLYIFTIPSLNKKCILRALGSGQQLRGLNINNKRPNIAVVDDLEDRENTATPLLQKKIFVWFFSTFLKALAKKHKVIYIGNMLSNDNLIKALIDLDSWNSLRLGSLLSNGKPLWPALWSLQALVDDYKKYVKLGLTDLWFAEMQNTPMLPPGSRLIDPDDITYSSKKYRDDLTASFITIDPATGLDHGDDTAIVVHGFVLLGDNNIRVEIVDQRCGKFDEIETVIQTLELVEIWGTTIIGIETVAYQKALKVIFELYCIMHGIEGLEYVELYAKSQKLMRITAWISLLKVGTYAISADDFDLVSQILAFDKLKTNNKDDLLDAASYGEQMIENYYHLILAVRQPQLAQSTVGTELAICSI